jgi:hypothetical protein
MEGVRYGNYTPQEKNNEKTEDTTRLHDAATVKSGLQPVHITPACANALEEVVRC